MSYKDVDTIVIDGTDYSVNKDEDNTYRLNLDPKDTGVNTIHIQSAKIEGKAYDIDRNMSYIYEKEVPTAENVTEIFEDTSTGEAVIRYKLIDKDSAVKELTAYMKNSAGSVIATKKIDLTEDETKTVTMPLLKISTYSIELKATWDIGDGVTFEDVSLLEKTKYTMPRVSIMTQEINKEYVEKGEEVELKFKINTNVDQEVKKIYINEEGYNVKKVTDDKGKIIEDTYTLTVNAPEKSGVFEQKVTKIQIGPNPINVTYPENSDIIKIKVLKDIPSLTHFIVDEKNGTVSFKVNDTDKSLITPNPVFKVKENDVEIYNDLLKNGGTDYVYELQKVNINKILNPYNVSVDVTYDRRPDSPSTKNIFEKIYESVKDNILKISSEEEQEGPDEEIEEPNYEITENIFNENIELTGDIDYDLHFDAGVGFLFSLNEYMLVDFECSTGTKYGVTKVIIDGREYPVTKVKDKGDGLFRYEGYYRAFDYTQDSITFEKVILENGTAIEIEEPNTREVFCMVIQKDPTFNVTDFIENVKEGTVTFNYKLVDDDMKLYSDLTFTLMDSQGSVIDTKVQTRDKNSVEFNIPNPPTSIYRLRVTGKSIIMPGYTDYLLDWVAHDEEYKSSVNTSILRSKISNKYPKKGETITIDYGISSTKVILIDKGIIQIKIRQ